MELSTISLKPIGARRLRLMLIAPLVMGASLPAVPLEESADVIVILAPGQEYRLNEPMPMERPINGRIIQLEKGSLGVKGLPEAAIVHTPNTITSPLKQGPGNNDPIF